VREGGGDRLLVSWQFVLSSTHVSLCRVDTGDTPRVLDESSRASAHNSLARDKTALAVLEIVIAITLRSGEWWGERGSINDCRCSTGRNVGERRISSPR
jgi:hypothetical protein